MKELTDMPMEEWHKRELDNHFKSICLAIGKLHNKTR